MPAPRTSRKKRPPLSSPSPRTRSRRTTRYIFRPATADEIIEDLGLTAADLRIVDRLVAEQLRPGASRRSKRR